MFIKAKDHVEKCPKCGMPVGYERDSFCHKCGEFFTNIGSRWFDPINKWNDQFSTADKDIQMEAQK
jgi:hypothetical protein